MVTNYVYIHLLSMYIILYQCSKHNVNIEIKYKCVFINNIFDYKIEKRISYKFTILIP